MTSSSQLGTLLRANSLRQSLRQRLDRDFLATTYRTQLYGGWRRHDGKWIDVPHAVGIRFHEAVKMLFCPCCETCHRRPEDCSCHAGKTCFAYLGQAPKDEDVGFQCPRWPQHGKIPWRRATYFDTVAALPGNRAGKSRSLAAELSAQIIGRRPWDDTLTAPAGRNRQWAYIVPTLSKNVEMTILPFLNQFLAGRIAGTDKNSSGSPSALRLSDPSGDIIQILSHVQFYNQPKDGTNPFEGGEVAGIAWDEPMQHEPRMAIKRGLLNTRSQGGGLGREFMAATPMNSVYLLDKVQNRAANMGGPDKSIYVVTGTMDENPSLTEQAKQTYLDQMESEEREARRNGYFLHLSGRIYPTFDEAAHIFDPDLVKPLGTKSDPSSWPIVMAVDPHLRRPWAMLWAAIDHDDGLWVVDEWPRQPFHEMKRSNHTFADYAKIIKETEDSFPGGRGRVLWHIMDPNMGLSPATGSGYDTIVRAMGKHGVFFQTDVSDDIPQGHQAVRQLLAYDQERPLDELNQPALKVSKLCSNVIWGFRHYVFDEWRGQTGKQPKEKPSETGKDFCDCFDQDTEVLTSDGWKHFAGLSGIESVATLSQDYRVEFQRPTEYIQRRYSGPMVRAHARAARFMVTPGHRMLVYPQRDDLHFRLASDIKRQDTIPVAALPSAHGDPWAPRFGLAEQDWAELLGWYIAEGSATGTRGGKVQMPGRGYQVIISQNEGPGRQRILELMRKTGLTVAVCGNNCIISNKKLWEEFRPLGNSEQKHIPRYAQRMSLLARQRLWAAMVAGDGWTHSNGTRAYATVSAALAEDARELLGGLGVACSLYRKPPGTWAIEGRSGRSMKQHWVMERKGERASLTNGDKETLYSSVDYEGDVFCVSVPNQTLLVRREGLPMFSGNCLRYIAMRKVRHGAGWKDRGDVYARQRQRWLARARSAE